MFLFIQTTLELIQGKVNEKAIKICTSPLKYKKVITFSFGQKTLHNDIIHTHMQSGL